MSVGADVTDGTGSWARLRGHAEGGALLVRPDGFVAARFGPVRTPLAMLGQGRRTVLAVAG